MLQQDQFLNVLDRDEAERRFHAVLDLSPLEAERIPASAALGRVLAEDVVAPVDVPAFDRANVDGFAVRSTDTFGASEDAPKPLRLAAEAIPTGLQPRHAVEAGVAAPIATGGMLPRGADAVVMIEHTDVRAGVLQLTRPAPPGANITFAGTDIGRGEVVLRRRDLLGARDTGVLAAIGVGDVAVIRRPRVAILSTGDELIPPGQALRPGCIYDSNSTVLADAVRELGGLPVPMGIVPDNAEALRIAVRRALDCDLVLLSGGTSKGAGDVSYRVLGDFGPPGVVAHGVALKPGKPLCLAAILPSRDRRPVPVAVLPGFPTSAIFTFHEFVAPILRKLAGRPDAAAPSVAATLPMRVNSERGRTEYLLVALVEDHSNQALPSQFIAYPLGKGSGSVTAFSRADGFIIIPRQREYLEAGSTVNVQLLDATIQPADLIVIGSHCTGLDYLLGLLQAEGITAKFLAVGSTAGLEAARRGECDLAGIHLLDPATDVYNEPFVADDLMLIRGYGRLQGIVFRPGDPRFEAKPLELGLADALADPECVLVNRNRGSGTRVLIDRLLGERRPPGYLVEARSHNAVVAAVAQGRADWGVAIAPAAAPLQLRFLPLRAERFDFVTPRSRAHRPAVRRFAQLLEQPAVRQELRRLGFEA